MDVFIADIIETTIVAGTFVIAFTVFVLARRRPSKPDAQGLADLSARLERIEQAVDTIAIEVERVSEGQRFTSRLLAEADRGRLPARQVTPH